MNIPAAVVSVRVRNLASLSFSDMQGLLQLHVQLLPLFLGLLPGGDVADDGSPGQRPACFFVEDGKAVHVDGDRQTGLKVLQPELAAPGAVSHQRHDLFPEEGQRRLS